ncbi:MAG: zf-HC2 domain-containing protein [Candidatus Magnetoovum sp. WYHC-5]|nr:zf-HC2 domain-containing protein [Candidatus Magnetoovum sp. WYHC-5]
MFYHKFRAKDISLLIDGRLEDKRALLLEEHLHSCSRCQHTLESFKKLTNAMGHLQRLNAPVGLAQNIQTKINTKKTLKNPFSRFNLIYIPMSALGVAIAVIILISNTYEPLHKPYKEVAIMSTEEHTIQSKAKAKNDYKQTETSAPPMPAITKPFIRILPISPNQDTDKTVNGVGSLSKGLRTAKLAPETNTSDNLDKTLLSSANRLITKAGGQTIAVNTESDTTIYIDIKIQYSNIQTLAASLSNIGSINNSIPITKGNSEVVTLRIELYYK